MPLFDSLTYHWIDFLRARPNVSAERKILIDAYICDAVRTPIGRYAGALSMVRADDLAAIPLRALLERSPDLDPAAVDEVFYGCTNQAGEDCRNVARMALLLAGLPNSVPGITLNRFCGSGLDAICAAARAIQCGEADLCFAGGVESLSRAPFVVPKAPVAFSRSAEIFETTGWRFTNPRIEAEYGADSMLETAEILAGERQISREDQDAYALRSQQRAARAQALGILAKEIVPVTVPDGKGVPTVVELDETPRETSMEALARLRPALGSRGTVTAGNSSGLNDGAAALIVASERAARSHGLTPLVRVVATATAGVPPRIMGIGPVPATRRVLALTGLTLSDFDVIEINETFAVQVLAVVRELGLPDDAEHVNAAGGAISLGHPFGMTGARLATTAALQLGHTGGRRALVTVATGLGQGIASILERV